MRFQFDDFAVANKRLGNNALRMDILEAMEGEGPDGKHGIVGTGNSMTLVMTDEVAMNHVIDIAITMGWITDQDHVEVATVTDLTEELQKRKKVDKNKKRRPKR